MPTIRIRKITTTVSRILQRDRRRVGEGGGKRRETVSMRSKRTGVQGICTDLMFASVTADVFPQALALCHCFYTRRTKTVVRLRCRVRTSRMHVNLCVFKLLSGSDAVRDTAGWWNVHAWAR